jgi:hypothetical protein
VVSSDVVNEEPVKITHTNLVRESFLQDPYDRQRPRRNGLSERRKGSVQKGFGDVAVPVDEGQWR